MSTTRNRAVVFRRFVQLAAVTAMLAGLIAPMVDRPQVARAAGAVTTSDLNLRSGPGLDRDVILVMPAGAAVDVLDGPAGGFYNVAYAGTEGWAHGDYLDFGDDSNADSETGPAVTTSALNLRDGPSTGDPVILVMPEGAAVTLDGRSSGGFLAVTYQGTSGWAYAAYLSAGTTGDAGTDPGSGNVGSAVTSAALNLRSGPGTGYDVLLVMPWGVSVTLTGNSADGFMGVSYNGVAGWAHGDYLETGTTSGEHDDGDVTSIIYAAADRYGQSRADMLRVARCESLLDPDAFNPLSSASGLFQFLPGTWATTPYAQYSIFDPWANANAAGWMWSVGRRNEWVCL